MAENNAVNWDEQKELCASNRKNSRAAYNLIQEIIYALDTMSQSSQIEDGSNLEGEALQEWLDNYELNL